MFLGILVLITALSISAVAIYYSVAGLVAIFAAAALPIIIMGSVLEIGKLVTAVWLHRYWREATWWLKTYLSIAVVVLMFITSMGIFGFLSRAHIEQTAKATQSVQLIEQIEDQISREQSVIERANISIESLLSKNTDKDQEIQSQIDREQERIDTAYSRIEPAVQEQQKIIDQRQELKQEQITEIQQQITILQNELEQLQSAIESNQIRTVQGIVGVRQDGSFGPGTQRAISEYRDQRIERLTELQNDIESIRNTIDPLTASAREEITRLRQFAEQQILDSNQLISRLRARIGTGNESEIESSVQEQQQKIIQANQTIDQLIEEKYSLETEYRKLEAEVGPVKYLAEFIYGESADKDLLEEAVRWVIVIIILVFDPLAVLLLIASQYTLELHRNKKDQENSEYTEKEKLEDDNFIRLGSIRSTEDSSQDSGGKDLERENRSSNNDQSNTIEHNDSTVGAQHSGRIDTTGVVSTEVNAVSIAEEYQSKKKTI